MNSRTVDPLSGLSVDSREFRNRALRVQSSPDPDTATAQTVRMMAQLARDSAGDPIVQNYAARAVERFRGGPVFAGLGQNPWENTGALAESVWWAAKHDLDFVHHSYLIYAWLNETDQLQLLIAPNVLLRMGKPTGDCAIYTMLIASALDALGIPWEIVTVAAERRTPGVYSHVYPRVILPDGRRVALDASHGKYPGWQVPAYDVQRLQVWDSNGNPVPDQGPQFEGLHNYAPRHRYRGPGGLAALEDDPTGGLQDIGADVPTPDYSTYPSYTPSPTTSTSGFDWSNLIGSLAQQWTKIGGQVVAPQTTVTRDSKGNLVINTPANAATATAAAGGLLLPSTGSSSILWLGLAAIAGIFLVTQLGKK